MRGYYAKCQEYRSDNGMDAWEIVWRNDLAICERCGSVVDLWVNEKCKSRKKKNVAAKNAGKHGVV